MGDNHYSHKDSDIAIIGMAGCFPGAKDINIFWEKLLRGEDCLTRFSEEDLAKEGIPSSEYNHKNYIRSKGIIEDPYNFDAGFFRMGEQEAIAIDPQKRLLLHTAWNALVDAGIEVKSYRKKVGVFVSASRNTYFDAFLRNNSELHKTFGQFKLYGLNDVDSLATIISYKLGLCGPSLTLQSACSSSLAAIHIGCRSLQSGDSDYVLAGGVSLQLPHISGYMYEPGGILSKTGVCRAFDKNADGTVDGSGSGVVALCRLADAIKDNLPIRAIVSGSYINNDGDQKMSIAAPRMEGQKEAISIALNASQIAPENIGYIETHGTATDLGDLIEMEALKKVFTSKDKPIFLGATKNNIGHLDAAAGVAGLIKTILVIESGIIPPVANFDSPNPALELDDSPFLIPTSLQKLDPSLYAGVSAFGVGGTNVHVILRSFDGNKGKKLRSVQPHVFAEMAYKAIKNKEKDDPISLSPRYFTPSKVIARLPASPHLSYIRLKTLTENYYEDYSPQFKGTAEFTSDDKHHNILVIDIRGSQSSITKLAYIKDILSRASEDIPIGTHLLFVSNSTSYVDHGIHSSIRSIAKESPEYMFRSLSMDNQCAQIDIEKHIIQHCASKWEAEHDICFSYDNHHSLLSQSYLEIPFTPDHSNNTINLNESVCMITGAFGGIGRELSLWLAREFQAKLVLIGRPPLSQEKKNIHDTFIQSLNSEKASFQVVYADISDKKNVRHAFAALPAHFDPIDFVFHTAGTSGDGFLVNRDLTVIKQTLNSKIQGAINIATIFEEKKHLPFTVYFSSLAALLGDIGQSDYVCANATLDALAKQDTTGKSLSINWGVWKETGMAVESTRNAQKKLYTHKEFGAYTSEEDLKSGLTTEEGLQAMVKAMKLGYPQIAICKENLAMLAHQQKILSGAEKNSLSDKVSPEAILDIFSTLLGMPCDDADTEFYDIGGDSLLALRLLDILEANYGIRIKLKDMFKLQTANALSIFIDKEWKK